MKSEKNQLNQINITYDHDHIYVNGVAKSPKMYKFCYCIMYVLIAFCLIIGIPTFPFGGFAFVIIGAICLIPALNFRKLYKTYLEQKNNRNILVTEDNDNSSERIIFTQDDMEQVFLPYQMPTEAEQALKIINDCVKIVNTTKKPDVFFPRYDLMEENVEILCNLKTIKYKGEHPKVFKEKLKNQKQAAIHDMIERFYEDAVEKSNKLKTNSGKRNKFHHFITVLEEYFYLMNEENIELANSLYKNAISNLDD